MQKSFRYFPHVVAFVTVIRMAQACDLCGCYTPQIEAAPQAEGQFAFGQSPTIGSQPTGRHSRTYFAIAEQFTHFGTLQVDGREVPNPSGQHEDSSITQLVAGYSFTPRFALQLNVPLIHRSFERPEGFAVDRGTESGLGDISLLATFALFRTESGRNRTAQLEDSNTPDRDVHNPDFTASVLVIGGVKLPSGDPSRLKEEFNESESPGAPQSGIHGHDLTLGTGSYDAIMGALGSLRYKTFFFVADTQFALRGDGAHQYHFANDLSWSTGPGYDFLRKRDVIAGVQGVVSGEHKDVDRFRGYVAGDTGITSVFLGPRIIAAVGNTNAELAVEFPILINNTDLQVVPDYRLRASLGIRF